METKIHTNGIGTFWSVLKRSFNGTYVSVELFHLERYLDEQALRFNIRHDTDRERSEKGLGQVQGRRLTDRDQTGQTVIAC